MLFPTETPDRLRLTVTLESGGRLETVRDEAVPPLVPGNTPRDLAWQADQYTQETIGAYLANDGWEAIGSGDPPGDQPAGTGQSPVYAVRNLS